ncbi:cellulose binding domain-containing protein [Micromonospora sp. U21]|uniref:cellulose binding domain-containing protein n=1 Tax=Micromonospora sp. U21 TaxID=2824899 RepID=UPI001B37CF37|nr:cellulose binding domain-containing protein [Micromonospora sp. U21]MBQ0901497.1 cellulose binding domain-containing protein [Micromonospora sp. U21]
MIEIGAQVDLSHPPDRVWLALTDRELLGRWFAEAETVAGVPDRLVLHTAGLPGFDANVEVEVTERRVPELLAMRCDEAGRLTEVTCVVTATKQGSRLAVREVTTHGTWSAEQHDPREQQLRQALTVRLPAILDWLAFQQVDLRRGEAGMTTELPTIGERPARALRRRRTVVAVLAGVVLVGGLAAWVTLPGEPDSVAAPPPATGTPPSPSSSVAAVAPTGTPRATPSARPSRTAASPTAHPSRTPTAKPSPTLASVPAAPPPVTATYRTDSSRLFGYTGEVVVDNPGGAPAADWVVVVTLAEGSSVDDVDGADVRQDGRTLTFTGPAVPAGKSQTIRFDVRDSRPKAREPESCTVGGSPCAGV